MGQVNAKNGKATNEFDEERLKVFGHQKGISNFVHKCWYYVFCSKK
jgi:hypothetical protein